jgi:hypothetical protein
MYMPILWSGYIYQFINIFSVSQCGLNSLIGAKTNLAGEITG